MKTILTLLKRYGPFLLAVFVFSELYARFWRRPIMKSFSQSKEDLILDDLTGHKRHGFYVDVGAYDPYRFSNTMRFYKRGWRGINIEPDTQRWARFQKERTRDINLNIGVGKKRGKLTYYRIDPPTLSTFDSNQADSYQKQGFTLLDTVRIPVLPLRDVFQKYAKVIPLDFMSIDVEGMEEDVLESNDWKKFRPHILCVESAACLKTQKGKGESKHIGTLLQKAGYKKVLDNGLNSFYRDRRHG